MKIKYYLIIATLLCTLSMQTMANDTHERMYLIQMLNQMDALKPLILAANNEQDKNARVKFHYRAFQDSTGKIS